MNKMKVLTASFVIAGLITFSNTFAQTTNFDGTISQIVRNSSLVTYTINNAEGAAASYSWNVTGGDIIVSGSPVTLPYVTNSASSTISVQVRWNNTLKTSANTGSISVTKTVGTCTSTIMSLNVNSWVLPDASSVTTTTSSVCSGVAPSVSLNFYGNSASRGFSYHWQIVRLSDNVVVEDKTNETNLSSGVIVPVTAITNNSAANVNYQFRLVGLQDAFSDVTITSFTASSVNFTVNAEPVVGPINSSNSLNLRP